MKTVAIEQAKLTLQSDPEIKKAAIHSLIQSIQIKPDAALVIHYILPTGTSDHSATGNRTPV